MARLFSAGKVAYPDISAKKLATLRGTNASAGPETVRVFRPDVGPDAAQDPAFAQEIAAKVWLPIFPRWYSPESFATILVPLGRA